MKRRHFLALAGGALAWPALSRSQGTGKVPRIGMAAFPPISSLAPYLAAFETGLREEGYVPGKDVLLDYRSADLNPARFDEVIRNLVQSRPDVIITGINANTAAVRAQTQTIPIVMMVGTDVVGQGLVKSLARPDGNITGLTLDVAGTYNAKRFEFLKLALPSISRVCVLYDPPYGIMWRETDEASAKSLGLKLQRLDITDDFERMLTTVRGEGTDAVYFYPGARQTGRRSELIAGLMKHRLPSSFPEAGPVEAGGLMSYGADIRDLYRRGAVYLSRVLKGAKPADLPVQQPTLFEFVINLKTAASFGLTIPRSVLLRVDRVIK